MVRLYRGDDDDDDYAPEQDRKGYIRDGPEVTDDRETDFDDHAPGEHRQTEEHQPESPVRRKRFLEPVHGRSSGLGPLRRYIPPAQPGAKSRREPIRCGAGTVRPIEFGSEQKDRRDAPRRLPEMPNLLSCERQQHAEWEPERPRPAHSLLAPAVRRQHGAARGLRTKSCGWYLENTAVALYGTEGRCRCSGNGKGQVISPMRRDQICRLTNRPVVGDPTEQAVRRLLAEAEQLLDAMAGRKRVVRAPLS